MTTTEDELVAIILPKVLENLDNSRFFSYEAWAKEGAKATWIMVDALMKQRAGHFTPEK